MLAIYAQTFGFGYINYDDPAYLTGNTHLENGLSIEGLRWALTTIHEQYYFPVTLSIGKSSCVLAMSDNRHSVKLTLNRGETAPCREKMDAARELKTDFNSLFR